MGVCRGILRPSLLVRSDCASVPEEEKIQYSSKLKEEGTRIGYKPRELFVGPLLDPGYLRPTA